MGLFSKDRSDPVAAAEKAVRAAQANLAEATEALERAKGKRPERSQEPVTPTKGGERNW